MSNPKRILKWIGLVFLLIGAGELLMQVALLTLSGLPVRDLLPSLLFTLPHGGIFAVIGWLLFTAEKRAQRRAASLKAEGDRITAQIIDVAQELHVRYNRTRHPWRIHCVGTDPVTGEERTFQSEQFMHDPTGDLLRTELDVYIDPVRRDRYYVDTDSAMH